MKIESKTINQVVNYIDKKGTALFNAVEPQLLKGINLAKSKIVGLEGDIATFVKKEVKTEGGRGQKLLAYFETQLSNLAQGISKWRKAQLAK